MLLETFSQSFTLNQLTLPNRLVMAPMTRSQSPGNIPTEASSKYYAERAKGGIGLIISEGTAVPHPTAHGYPQVPNFYGEEALEGWKRIVKAVQREGSCFFPQLWHVGSVHQNKNSPYPCDEGVEALGPSAVGHPGFPDGGCPVEATKQDIEQLIEAFASAAESAKEIGCDGIEIHGAHGYLIDQFFWEKTNQRKDGYGGVTAAARTRFACELIQEVRNRVGKDFPIMLRFSQWKLGDYGAKLCSNPAELEAFLQPLSEAGVDCFHCSTRRFTDPEFSGSPLNLAGWTKKLTGKPVVTVGGVGLDKDFIATLKAREESHSSTANLKTLEQGLSQGDYDLVALGRVLIADPYWWQKVEEGKADSIIPFSVEKLKKL